METRPTTNPRALSEQIQRAINAHDLDTLVACIDPHCQNEHPVHPDRTFKGSDQVRANWSQIFRAVPDLKATIIRSAIDGDTSWTEWEWVGTRRDGAPFQMRSVIVNGIRDGRIAWGRLYMEPVQEEGRGIDSAVKEIVR